MPTAPNSTTIRVLACGIVLTCLMGTSRAAVSPGAPPVVTKKLAPGITWTQELDPPTPLLITVVAVELDAPGVKAEGGSGQDHVGGGDVSMGREDVSRYARRH